MVNTPLNVGVVAGEASGDLLGAGLMTALQTRRSPIVVSGIGGPTMMAAGCHSLHDSERLAVMGLIEPLFHLPELIRIRRDLIRYFLESRPDVFVGIDSPDFNLGLELTLRRAGIPVIHYVSPSVWAWRQKRIHKIARATDLVLTLFPFEADFYQKHNVPAKFVGHPLADAIPLQIDKEGARKKLGLAQDVTYVAILPGSRRNELKYLAEVFVKTAEHIHKQRPSICFVTSAINPSRDAEFQQLVQRVAPQLPITFFQGRSHDVLAASDIVLVTSGTATLETMLFKKPMVIAYRMSTMTYAIARHLVKLKCIGLPNLLADERLVPEFIQNNVTPENLSRAILDFLDHPAKMDSIAKRFTDIHHTLRCDANQQAANAVLELLYNR